MKRPSLFASVREMINNCEGITNAEIYSAVAYDFRADNPKWVRNMISNYRSQMKRKSFAEIMPEMYCQDAESLVTSSPAT